MSRDLARVPNTGFSFGVFFYIVNATGTDFDTEQIAIAQRLHHENGLLRFQTQDASSLEFEAGRFDLVVSQHVFHYQKHIEFIRVFKQKISFEYSLENSIDMENISDRISLALNDAIHYQDASIVSKIILKKKTGSVTLFAFDKGQELSEHTTPHDALLQVFDGEANVTISGQVFLAKAGEMIILPANEPHAVQAQQKFKMMLTMIRS